MATLADASLCRSLMPPPGLVQDLDSPAKVELKAYGVPLPITPSSTERMSEHSLPCYAPMHFDSTPEWVQASMGLAPHLHAQGLQHAFGILGSAGASDDDAQHKEADPFSGLWAQSAAEFIRWQAYEQQQWLLRAGLGPVVPQDSFSKCKRPTSKAYGQQEQKEDFGKPGTFARLAAPVADKPKLRGGAAQGGEREAAGASGMRQVSTLSTSLQTLSSEEPDCLFIVRRINKLGFKATRTLKEHFSSCGTVVRVLVAHSTVRQRGDPQCHARRRPSSLGFVHMATAEAVQKVLARGAEQQIGGSLILVQRFERQRDSVMALANVAEEEGHEEKHEADCFRRFSSYSEVSTQPPSPDNRHVSQAPDYGEEFDCL